MPNKDKTGPEGEGSKTGRQTGDCEDAEPVAVRGQGLGPCGRGLSRGRGYRRN